MPHENKFPGRAHAENILSVQTKFDSPPPSLRIGAAVAEWLREAVSKHWDLHGKWKI